MRVDRPDGLDVSSAALRVHLDQRLLQSLPVSRDAADLINLAPGVTRSVGFGGTIGSNALSVEGVETTEPRRQAAWIVLPTTWAAAVDVVGPGADVDRGEFTGVVGEARLKTGSNELSGLAEWWTTHPSWIDEHQPNLGRRLDDWWQLDLQTGLPLAGDRVWLFAAGHLTRLEERPPGFTGTGTRSEWTPRYLARLSAVPSPRIRLEGWGSLADADRDAVDLGPSIPIAVASRVEQREVLGSVNGYWTPGARTLVDMQYGAFESRRSMSPRGPGSRIGPPPTIDFGRSLLSDNARRYDDNSPGHQQVRGSLTQLLGASGQHEVRLGGEYEVSTAYERSGLPGGRELRTRDGILQNVFAWDGDETEATGRRGAIWARDQWRVHPHVTVTAGLRLDINRGAVPGRGTVLTTEPVSPRAGIVWDIGGRQATAVKVHAGRYADSLLLNRVMFMHAEGLSPQVFLAPGADGALSEIFRFTPDISNRRVDPDLRHSRVNELLVSLEQRLGATVRAELVYVRRRFDRFMALVDEGSRFAEVTRLDPGPDGVDGTADDAGLIRVHTLENFGAQSYVYTNPPGAFRRFQSLQAVATRRYANRWQLQASVSWSWSDGTIGNVDFANAGSNDTGEFSGTFSPGVYVTPNGQINARGRAPYTFNEAKLVAFYEPPWLGGWLVSGVFRAHSGYRWERFVSYSDLGVPGQVTVRVEPRGTRSLDPVAALDLRGEKRFTLSTRLGVALYADVLNVTNQSALRFVNGRSGPQFGQTFILSDPRAVRAGLKVTF